MKKQSAFTRIISWLKTTELFARPSREVPGRWQLFEYYSEPAGDLVHVEEKQLAERKNFWEIEFSSNGLFSQKSNLPVQFLSGYEACEWHLSGNFITLVPGGNPQEKEKFQFAVEKQNLKLLKKDASGRIEFFGFFKKEAHF